MNFQGDQIEIIKSDPIELEYFGEHARLGLNWDLSKPAETIQLRIDMPDINTGRFLKRSGGKDILDGKLTLAVVDPRGCVVNKETVDGPFENPEVKETGVVQRTVIRPLKSFLKSGCEAFYDGSVPHPSPAPKK